ncbi:MAG: 16S rRNA (uracil(1498)-N(3))-methyltransferase [Desulfotignum sp.]|nr:16S rRNA (uracil(1498)-N(3))-methyltransferase [Desulfotignum sp.]
MHKFLIPPDQVQKNKGIIDGPDARHISRVLRLSRGDLLHLTNGMGTDFSGCIIECTPEQVVVEMIDAKPSITESPLSLTVCTGMLKHQKMDDVIKGLTQTGITRWIPFYCERSVPLPDSRGLARRMERWQAIARETIKQCRRSRVVEISFPINFDEVLELAKDYDHCIAFWEQGGRPLSGLEPGDGSNRTIMLTGPEGGFSEPEIDQASARGFVPYSLGPRILRAETASLCGAALIQHRLGDM